jgi:dCMP deaminase
MAYKSPDESTKVGSVITTKDNVHITSGYNGICRGIEHKPNMQIRPEKYHWFEHAERNAIYNAGRTGARLDLAYNIYIPWLPCSDCVRAIIQTGIKRIVVHKQGQEYHEENTNHDKWKESHKITLEMINSSNVFLEYYDDIILGDLCGFFSGNVVKFD